MDYIRLLQEHSVFLILMGLVALSYLSIPFTIKCTFRARRHFSLDEFDPLEVPLPSHVASFFNQTVEQLDPIGFRSVHHFLIPDVFPNVAMVILMFENRVRDNAAIAAVIYGFQDESHKEVCIQEKYVEFCTDFVDGSEISTNNNRRESAFKQVSQRRIAQFPDMKDISTLYLAHQRLVEQFGKPPKRSLPAPGQWAEALRRDITREFVEQLDTGYLQLNASQEFFRMTWKGAYLMVWKQMWPISQIRLALRRRKARKLLAEFDLAQRW